MNKGLESIDIEETGKICNYFGQVPVCRYYGTFETFLTNIKNMIL